MSSSKSVLDNAMELLPEHRQLKLKAKPKVLIDDSGIRFDNLGICSGISRRDIRRTLNIQAVNNMDTILRNSFKFSCNGAHKGLVLYYLDQKTTISFTNVLTKILLSKELVICKNNKIKLLHAGHSNIAQIERQYTHITKYPRFSNLRNKVVKQSLEKYKKYFAEFSEVFSIQEMLNIYEDNKHRKNMQERFKYMHILYVFRIWLRYKNITKISNELTILREYLTKVNGTYSPYWYKHR